MSTPYVWTFTKFVTAVRNTVGDPSGAATERWTDAEIEDYGNRSLLVVGRDAERAFETVWTASLVTDQYEYEMDASFDRDKWVEWQNDTDDIRRMVYVPFSIWQERFGDDPTDTGDPYYYTFWRKLGSTDTAIIQTNILVHPAPSTSVNTKTLRVYGYKRPEALDANNATRVLELEAPYVEAAVMWCAYLMMRDDGDHVSADRFRGEYEAQKNGILDHLSRKTRSSSAQLRPRDSVLSPYPWKRGPYIRRW